MRKRNHDHNRYLGFERVRSQSEFENERSQPTFKQKKFFKRLVMLCKENDVDYTTGRTQSRVEYAIAIDKLKERLDEAGINVGGNNKQSMIVLSHKTDVRNK